MKILWGALLFVFVFFLSACNGGSGSPVSIQDAWVRPAIMDDGASGGGDEMSMDMDGPTSAGYMVIKNSAATADRLLSAESDSAKALEIHLSEMVDGVMTMRPVDGGLEIPAKGQMELKPGSYHIMFVGVQQDFKVGDKINLTLNFENAGEIKVEAEVRNP